jgi:hypothetical protein
MSEFDPDLPKPDRIRGRNDFWRSQVEDFRDTLLHEPLAERLATRAKRAQQAPRSEPDSLVPAKVAAAEVALAGERWARGSTSPRRAGMNRSAGRHRSANSEEGGRNGSLR